MACFQTWQQVSTEWALNLSISSIFKSGRCKPLPHASSKNLLLNYIHFLTTYLPRLSNIDYGTWTSKANQANIIPSHTVCTSGGWTPNFLTLLLLTLVAEWKDRGFENVMGQAVTVKAYVPCFLFYSAVTDNLNAVVRPGETLQLNQLQPRGHAALGKQQRTSLPSVFEAPSRQDPS